MPPSHLVLPTRRMGLLSACPSASWERDPSVDRQTRLKTLPSLVLRMWSVIDITSFFGGCKNIGFSNGRASSYVKMSGWTQ